MSRTWLWSADKHFVNAYMAGWGTEPQTVIRCEHCEKVIVSQHRHDFRGCDCPITSDRRVFIDGGQAYTRIAWDKDARFTEHTSAPAQTGVDDVA